MLARIWLPALILGALVGGVTMIPVGTRAMLPPDVATFLDYAVPSAIWLTGAWLASRLADALLWDRLCAETGSRRVPRLVRDTLALLFFLIAISGILADVFGQPLTGVFAASSVIALVLGLALRNVILDIFTGLAVNLDRSYRVGDWIEVHHRDFKLPIFGKVTDINWRTTRIELESGNLVVIPNNVMSIGMTTNFSVPDGLSRFEASITLEPSVGVERSEWLLLAAAMSAVGPGGPVADPQPRVVCAGITHLGVDYRILYWFRVDDASPSSVKSAVISAVLHHLHIAGVKPALPRQHTITSHVEAGASPEPAARLTALVARVPFLAQSLEPGEIAALAGRMAERSFTEGEALLRQGEPGTAMFLIAEGLVDVRIRPEDGEERVVSHIGPGEVVGEMSMLTGAPRSATVAARTRVVAFSISKENVERLIALRPEIAERLSYLVAERRIEAENAFRPEAAREAETTKLSAYVLHRMRALFLRSPEVVSTR